MLFSLPTSLLLLLGFSLEPALPPPLPASALLLVLVLNTGSSSVKYQLVDSVSGAQVAGGGSEAGPHQG